MTRGISLRDVEDADLTVFLEQQRDPDAIRMAAFTPKEPLDAGAFEARWKRLRSDATVVPRTILCDGRVAGHIMKFEMDGRPEVTYWVGRPFWGKGVASTALRDLLREVTVRPIFGRAAKDNAGSIRVLEKAGFTICAEERGFADARGQEIEEVVLRLDA